MSAWKPIETAPKHVPILMLMNHCIIEGEWNGESGVSYYGIDIGWPATHWMPLPEPPTE